MYDSSPMPNTFDSRQTNTLLLSYGTLNISSSDSAKRLRGASLSAGISLNPSGIQIFITHGTPVSFAKYSEISRHLLPCSIQNLRTSPQGDESVRLSRTMECEKNVGLKSIPIPLSLAKSTHALKCFGCSASRSANSPSSKIA